MWPSKQSDSSRDAAVSLICLKRANAVSGQFTYTVIPLCLLKLRSTRSRMSKQGGTLFWLKGALLADEVRETQRNSFEIAVSSGWAAFDVSELINDEFVTQGAGLHRLLQPDAVGHASVLAGFPTTW